jgi:hypothetical protein
VTYRSKTSSVFEQNEENNQGRGLYEDFVILNKGKGAGEVLPPPLPIVAHSCTKGSNGFKNDFCSHGRLFTNYSMVWESISNNLL